MAVLTFDEFVAVPIPVDLYAELLSRHPGRVSTVIENVTRDFLERTAEDHPKKRRPNGAGVSWESVSLPSGSRLRTRYFGEYKYAEIKGDSILCEDEEFLSISQLANHMRGGTNNNAWVVMEIMRPNDREWIKADLLRRR